MNTVKVDWRDPDFRALRPKWKLIQLFLRSIAKNGHIKTSRDELKFILGYDLSHEELSSISFLTETGIPYQWKMSGAKKVGRHDLEWDMVIDHLNRVTGSNFKKRTAVSKNITRRLAEGHTVEDLKRVIDVKWEDWNGTKFEKYCVPSTLFRPSKFEGYLNQAAKKPPSLKELLAVKEWGES